jgi:serine carboxypeptidase-like clade 1
MLRSIVAATFAAVAVAAPTADLMTDLPDAPAFTTDTYSGYLTVNDTKSLHYVFATSMSATAATDPVVIWFNGGPGCSSMLGFM